MNEQVDHARAAALGTPSARPTRRKSGAKANGSAKANGKAAAAALRVADDADIEISKPQPRPRAAFSDLAQALDAGTESGDLHAAAAVALKELQQQAGAGDALAPLLARLIEHYRDQMARLPVLHDAERLPIHYDDHMAQCFENIVALLRVQDTQIAELWTLVHELV